MEKLNLQDKLIAKRIKKENVNANNTTLIRNSKYQKIDFKPGTWCDSAKAVLSSCRKNNQNKKEENKIGL